MAAMKFTLFEDGAPVDPRTADAAASPDEAVASRPRLRPIGEVDAIRPGLDSLIATVVQLLVSSAADEPMSRRIGALNDALQRAVHVLGASSGAVLTTSAARVGSSAGVPEKSTRCALGRESSLWSESSLSAWTGDPAAGVVAVDGRSADVVTIPIAGSTTPALLAFAWDHPRTQLNSTRLDCTVLDRLRTFGGALVAGLQMASLFRRPSMDDRTGIADRRLFLIELGRQLALLGEDRLVAVAVLWIRLPQSAPGSDQAHNRLGAELERRIGSSDLVASFDADSLVISLPGLRTSHDVVVRATQLRSAIVSDAAPDPTLHIGVAHTRRQIPAGVLLRQAEGAAHLAQRGGEPVRVAAES